MWFDCRGEWAFLKDFFFFFKFVKLEGAKVVGLLSVLCHGIKTAACFKCDK